MKRNILLVGLGTLLSFGAVAQEAVDLFDLSLEELMNVEIVSASKKEESTFDAPVSSSVITRDEISRSGVTSIPEALRLSPGLIVRETTNGNYEVFVRGFDNLHRYGSTTQHHNLYTLVMIDNRPVFNYNEGGVYWEALPVDLIDVERIEIVRGPSAPLFGPNAVTGVINIITRRPEGTGVYASGNLQYGTPDTKIANAAVGGQIGQRWNVIVSGNYQERTRHDELYYEYQADQFAELPNPSLIADMNQAYPDMELAMEKKGLNAFVDYRISDDTRIELSTGMQDAVAQRFNSATENPLTFTFTNNQYINVAGKFHGLGVKYSYTHGYDNLVPGGTFVAEYDFDIIDAVVDYQWEATDKLSIRPSLSYQQATYDDTKYTRSVGGLFNGSPSVNNVAGSLRGDYLATERWRLIAGLRVDKFSNPDDAYLSYQFASTYKLHERYLFRAAHSRSNSSAFLNNEIDLEFPVEVAPGSGISVTNRLNGNPEPRLATVTMSEVGFRGQFTENLQLDVEVFRQHIKDISSIAITGITLIPTGAPAPNNFVPDVVQSNFVTLPLTGIQKGVTLSVNYVPEARLQLRPFVTLQRTEVKDLSLALTTLPMGPNINTTTDARHESTPSFFGGAYVNFAATSRLNVNASTFFYGRHTAYASVDLDPNRVTEVNDINGKLLVNAKVSYRVVDQLRIYGTVRNALDSDSREHYGTDRIGRSFFGGVSYSF